MVMQNRMKNHQLDNTEIAELLNTAKVGRFATLNEDGFPYVVAMHFVYHNEKIYMHGLPKGQKIDNINRCSKACFEVDEMFSFITDGVENACDVNTEYNSVVVLGHAVIIDDLNIKRSVLNEIVKKYTPRFSNKELPTGMVMGSAVIEMEILECTGKYYK